MQIEVSNAEIVDKATILKLKAERITDPAKVDNIKKEYEYLMQKVAELDMDANSNLFKKLYDINARIWDTETALREREAAQNFDAQFIQWSRDEYTLNDDRANIKKEINKQTQSNFMEEKSHATVA